MNFKSVSFKYLVLCSLMLIPLSVSAQKKGQARIDSLLKQLPAEREDTGKVQLLIRLGNTYSTLKKTDATVFYLQHALLLAEKLKWQKGMTRSYGDLGACYYHQADYDKAETYLKEAVDLSFKLKDYRFAAESVGLLAAAISFQKGIPQAINYLMSAAGRFIKNGQTGSLVHTYMLIGDYNKEQFNYSAAIDYYDKALHLETTKRKFLKSNDLIQIGNLYLNLHNIKKARMLYLRVIEMNEQASNRSSVVNGYIGLAHCADAENDASGAANYYNKAIQMAQKTDDYDKLSETENEISWNYFVKKDYDKAYLHARRAMSYVKANPSTLAYAASTMGSIYREAPDSVIKKAGLKPGRQYEKSLALLLSAINYGKAHGDFNLANENLEDLSLTYEKLHRYADAFKAYRTYISEKDSIDRLKNEKAILLKDAQLNYSRKEDALKYQESITNAQLKQQKLQSYFFIGGIAVLLILSLFIGLNYYNQRKSNKLLTEANVHITNANHELGKQREEITSQRDKLIETVAILKMAQAQLIQSEKMASLGELTAGIAHEIQNPLNFVNNFSEVSIELIQELKEEAEAGNKDDVLAIADDLTQNLQKINNHGKRADGIVKAMLQHSRATTGQKEPTNINALTDEYLRLAYHGLRAKDKSFNAEMITHFDEALPFANIVPQEIGRVLLNLYNNAFYAIQEKSKIPGSAYKPTVEVCTKKQGDHIDITVKDNGMGIPDHIKDKIMQPFFTTKPTGQGTGLGLSLSYDIVIKGHAGNISINSKEGEGSEIIVTLPLS